MSGNVLQHTTILKPQKLKSEDIHANNNCNVLTKRTLKNF